MILNVYCYYNTYLEAFGNFQLDDHEPDKVCIGLQRDVKANFLQGKDITNLRGLKLYILGQFNDEKGEFKNDKHELLDFSVIVSQLEALAAATKKGAENNGDNINEEVKK